MDKNRVITVQNIPITISRADIDDYICITDMAAAKSDNSRAADVIKNWLRNRNTLEFLGTWEQIYNANFKVVEFDHFRQEAGLHTFVISVGDWVEQTNAIGLYVKKGRYGGTYAHKDIAFEFASWISPEFKLYIIEDYQRLKAGENARLSLNWNLNREISKLNYRVHTDAIKEKLIPPLLTSEQISYTYASEADLLNTVLFGKTAKQWRDDNPKKSGNIRDNATLYQLLVLANMESYNAIMIKQGKTQVERMNLLHELAVQQMTSLSSLELNDLPEINKK